MTCPVGESDDRSLGMHRDISRRDFLNGVAAGVGLAAAHFFRDRAASDVRVLVLDNHDDFGGHAPCC